MQDAPYRTILAKTKGHTVPVLVSPSDYAEMAGFHWSIGTHGYAVRNEGDWRKGTHRMVLMHRSLMGLEHGNPLTVDHVNRDRLDNRRENLRVVTHARNMCNLAAQAGTSRYRGVSWDKDRGIWKATATHQGRQHHLGRFADEKYAAAAVNAFWRSRGCEAPNDV